MTCITRCTLLIAVVFLCGDDTSVFRFMKKALELGMVDGEDEQYMYLSIRTVHENVVRPWHAQQAAQPSTAQPSTDTLAAFRNLMQVTCIT